MGNIGSTGANNRRRHGSRRHHPTPPPPANPQPEITANRYVFAAATPYPNQPPPYYQYPGYYPPPPPPPPPHSMPLPVPFDQHHRGGPHPHMDPANWVGGRYPYGPVMQPQTPYVEHQKAVTIRNDVNLKKETLRVEPDVQNPGRFLVTFTFDATVAGSVTVYFLAKEGDDCNLTPTKENIFKPFTVHFEKGLGQKFRQSSGTGIEFSAFEESELVKVNDEFIYPLVIKADSSFALDNQTGQDGKPEHGSTNSQITQAVFEKEKGEFQVRVVKQILWVNGMRYELQEIYGIGNSVEGEMDGNDNGKECVICLSEPRDTTALPCRHMCMCNGCAKVLRFQTNRCPICRQPIDRLLEIKVSNVPEE